jgi:hypothetical protein
MHNSSNSPVPLKVSNSEINGITKARQAKIASLIAQGYSVKYVAKKVNMSESRIYHLLSEKNSFVNEEINHILNELFAVTDRQLINLYSKTLQKLDAMLSSSDKEKQYRAMDRIIKMYYARIGKNAIIQQYFCAHPQSQQLGINIGDIDKLIIKKRIERGLEKPPDYKDSSNSPPENSALPASASPTPVSETPVSNEPSADNSSQGTAAPGESSRDWSPPDLPAETREFVDRMNEPPPPE